MRDDTDNEPWCEGQPNRLQPFGRLNGLAALLANTGNLHGIAEASPFWSIERHEMPLRREPL